MSPILFVLLVLVGWFLFGVLTLVLCVAAGLSDRQSDAARCQYLERALDRELDKILGRHAANPQIPDHE